MTRYDVLQLYSVKDGKIETMGIFKDQALYVPYFWSRYLAGEAHEVGKDTVQFSVSESDRIQFPELGNRNVIRLRPEEAKIVEA